VAADVQTKDTKMHTKSIVHALSIVFALSLASGCGEKKETKVVRREGQPDFVQAFDKKLMDSAIAEAASTTDVFVSALQSQDAQKTNFLIKKGYTHGEDEKEFIWINEVKLVGTEFEGKINNEPVNDIGVKFGQTVRVKKSEVADWMFMDDGRLQGGYTIAALIYGKGDQKEYENRMKIDWTQYKFLKANE
jgi:uncharacterized protein YegJ (DUF2314 family)